MIKLMYITNRPEVAGIVEECGVDRIFVDMEYIGKNLRQGGMDTVQSHHTFADIRAVRKVLQQAQLLVRCNPIHDGSYEEIRQIIDCGADIIMLPYFKTPDEVERFLQIVHSDAKTMLLFEHCDAVASADDILSLPGIDEVYIGLNDLSLSYRQKFMFEPLANGTVDHLVQKFKTKGLPFGFGGIASLGKGLVPSEYIIKEHYRLGSSCAILSRSFCNAQTVSSQEQLRDIFQVGIRQIRALEKQCLLGEFDYLQNRTQFCEKVEAVLASLE